MESLQEYKGFKFAYHPMQNKVCLIRKGKQYYIDARFRTYVEETRLWIDAFIADEEFENEMLNEYN